MIKKLLYIIPIFLFLNAYSQKRVDIFFNKNYEKLKVQFKNKNLTFPPKNVFIRVFKYEGELELWVADSVCDEYKLFKSYRICMNSGELGPKRKEGDLQIPEGFYYITQLKTITNYHLALKINYPNESDLILGDKNRPGGEIYLHGKCVSIGCVSVNDNDIEEVFILVELSRKMGQTITPVQIFPINFSDRCSKEHFNYKFTNKENLLSFEKNLEEGYNFFVKHKRPPLIIVDETGKYLFF
jgi:murein L,D-transpeptidase YafK